MRICPRCQIRYSDESRFCDLDGAVLEPHDPSGIDVEFSNATSAESPSGRRLGVGAREFSSYVPPLPGSTTIIDGGTRLSLGDSPPPEPAPPPKPRSRTRMLAEQRLGQVLGSYRLAEVLGTGGMGAVYRAEHIKLGRQVALKLLHPQFAKRRDALARFFQEAQAVNRIRHKNIVDVTDLVELDDGTAFIIMELLSGLSLGEYLKTIGLLGAPDAVSVLIQICDALAAAHEADIVHRDLKPDNIFLSRTDDGHLLVKLLDFGVAKLINPDTEVGHRTAAGSVVGTPAFMSPEQAAGLEIDQRSDLYSLGAIMYQLFTGQPVFSGKSFSELVNKHLTVEPMAPRETPGGVRLDRDIDAIIMRCLRKSPEARFQSARELREALVAYLAKLADDLGTEIETASGIYRLMSARRESSYTPPPAALSGPLDPRVIDTALAAGDLDPNWRTSTRSSRLPLYIAVAVALTATLVAIGVVSEGGGRESSAPQPVQTPPPPEPDAAANTEIAAPVITPIEQPPVEVRFRSSPPARVFARGSSKPECAKTPCKVVINPGDGGSPERRQYVLRAPGHQDETVEVLLARPRPEYRVTLEPIEEPEPEVTPGKKTSGKKTSGKKTSGKKTSGKKTSGKKTSGEREAESKRPSGTDTSGGSGPVRPDVTLDPFSRKKSK